MNKIRNYTQIISNVSRLDIISAVLGSFFAISTLAYVFINYNSSFLIASFGASAVILYATPNGIFARPQNLVGGHLIAATVGVIISSLFGMTWWSLALGVSITIFITMLTNTIHPPAGATALVAIMSHAKPIFILMPVFTGVMTLLIWAIITNKLREKAISHKESAKLD